MFRFHGSNVAKDRCCANLDRVERLTDDVFERFLDVLIEYRGPFLQQIATKVSLTLDAMVNSAEFELADADPPPVLHLAYDSAELIGSCDIY